MKSPLRIAVLSAAAGAFLAAAPFPSFAADAKPTIPWTARDTAGKEVAVPSRQHTTIVAFLRPGQPHSEEALKHISDIVAKQSAAPAGVVIVLSGPDNAAAASKINPGSAQVVLDAEYALSGKMNVHVWPATIVVTGDGMELARLSGMPATYATDLAAHLDFAAKKIDRAALEQRLTTRRVVAATTQQAATRFLIIANALLERGQVEQALAEIDQGLQRDANDVSLRLARARVLIKLKQFDAALAAVDQLKDAVPPWQSNVLRAEALIALERWPNAKTAVADALKLNPRPAHAHYLSGLILLHEQDYKSAAESFRKAYEAAVPAEKR